MVYFHEANCPLLVVQRVPLGIHSSLFHHTCQGLFIQFANYPTALHKELTVLQIIDEVNSLWSSRGHVMEETQACKLSDFMLSILSELGDAQRYLGTFRQAVPLTAEPSPPPLKTFKIKGFLLELHLVSCEL